MQVRKHLTQEIGLESTLSVFSIQLTSTGGRIVTQKQQTSHGIQKQKHIILRAKAYH